MQKTNSSILCPSLGVVVPLVFPLSITSSVAERRAAGRCGPGPILGTGDIFVWP